MSDILQFDCSIDNEIARNATKHFAEMLGKAFKQYKKLWNEYLKLRKHCEDANFKIPFQLFELDDYNDKDVSTSSQECGYIIESPETSHLSENEKPPTDAGTNVFVTCSSKLLANLDENVLFDDECDDKQTKQETLLSSPILVEDRFRYRKNINTPSHISNDSKEKIVQQHLSAKENVPILANSTQKTELSIEPEEDELSLFSINENDNEIQSTPTVKVSRKLGISTLYNVDTTLLKNGKKRRQSKLVFLPSEQSANNRLYPLKSYGLPTSKTINQNNSVDEEIIQVSPNKHRESNLRIKNLKAERKSPGKGTRNNNANSSLKESDQLSLNRNLFSPCTSEEKNHLSPLIKCKTFSSSDEKMKTNRYISSSLSPVDTPKRIHFVDNKNILTEINKNEESESLRNIDQPKEELYSELPDQNVKINSSFADDETFCFIAEKFKEIPRCNTGKLQTVEENMIKEDRSPKSSPVRRSLLSSFNVSRKRKIIQFEKPPKKRSDRAQMAGVTCWECKKYYGDLGLSEEEIKTRQNQCSRHRADEKERTDTPDGFWNPLFSATYRSTLQDD